MSKTISQTNLPNIKLTVDSFSLSRGNMDITGGVNNSGQAGIFETPSGVFYGSARSLPVPATGQYYNLIKELQFKASRSWTGTTNSVSPQTNSLGSGRALDITPSYYTTHMWLRTS